MQETPARSGATSASRSRLYGHGTVPLLEQSLLSTAVHLGCYTPITLDGDLTDRLENLVGVALAIEQRASAMPARPERKRR